MIDPLKFKGARGNDPVCTDKTEIEGGVKKKNEIL